MSKKQLLGVVVVAALVAWVFTIFPGRFLAAKISTWPLLNKWQILSPQAPIVITNRETVRVSDSGDVVSAADQMKSKISSVVLVSGHTLTIVGTAVNLTTDGSFVTAASSFSSKAGNYFVVLNDGRQAAVAEKVLDPATSLVFFKAALDGVSTAQLGNSNNMALGEKVLFAQSSLKNFTNKISEETVGVLQSDVTGELFQSDYPRRSFGVAGNSTLTNALVLANTNAEVVGISNGNLVVSSDVLKQALTLYLKNQKEIIRPSFGFSYKQIGENESKLTGQAQGALISSVGLNSAAVKAGLLAGDIITKVDEQIISESLSLEEVLQKYQPGEKVSLAIVRGTKNVNLTLIAGQLK